MQRNTYQFKPHVGHHHGKNGKIYGPGDIILLYEHETRGFADKLLLVSTPGETPATPCEAVAALRIVEVEGGFDVVNPLSSTKVNAKPLTKDQARSLAGPEAELIEAEPPAKPKARLDRKLTSVHKGSGRYVVLDEATGNIVAGGPGKYLSKAEAEEVVNAG